MLNYRGDRDTCCLGTKNSAAKSNDRETHITGELYLSIVPTAFRTDQGGYFFA